MRIICPTAEGGLAPLFALDDLRTRLESIGEVLLAEDVPSSAELARRVADADVVLLTTHLTDEMLHDAAGRLRLVAFPGTGVASYLNVDLARELGITVTNVTHYGDRAVAELTLGLMLAAVRDIPGGDRAVREGRWEGWAGRELAGSSLAVVGFGGIGRAVARMGHALGMRVLVVGRTIDPAALAEVAGTQVGMAEAFGADVVSLHLPLVDATRGIVGDELLDLLRPGSVLVNTARAELIAPGALAKRLARGDVRAALDVFDPEPLPSDDPLLSVPGTVFTPHLGYRSPGALLRMADGAVANVEAFAAGSPINVV